MEILSFLCLAGFKRCCVRKSKYYVALQYMVVVVFKMTRNVALRIRSFVCLEVKISC